jgi:DNA primase
VGFGGRILPGFESEREPKYLNSPESPLFSKRRLLFGLHQARTHKAGRLVVMEGYTDVIMAQLAGVHGAVATLGTALTRQHATLLRRFSSEGVILLFDGDAAGRRAAERAFHVLAPEELDARICLLPEGLDPADLVQQEGAAALEAVLEDAKPAWEIFVELLGQRCDLATPDGRSQAASACKELLGGIEEGTRRRILGEQLARSLMLPDGALLEGVKSRRSPPARAA